MSESNDALPSGEEQQSDQTDENTTMSENESDDDSEEQENKIWEVSCTCGFSNRFQSHDDAEDVFEVHNNDDPRCGGATKRAIFAYAEGAISPERTLPDNRYQPADD